MRVIQRLRWRCMEAIQSLWPKCGRLHWPRSGASEPPTHFPDLQTERRFHDPRNRGDGRLGLRTYHFGWTDRGPRSPYDVKRSEQRIVYLSQGTWAMENSPLSLCHL